MFSGDDRAAITTEMPEEQFYEKVQEMPEPLGDIEVSDSGAISISPKSSLVSFLSTLSISGKVKSTDDGFKVEIEYSVAPSVITWIIAIALFCTTVLGVAVIVVPLVLDKPNVQKAVEKGLRNLKDELREEKEGQVEQR